MQIDERIMTTEARRVRLPAQDGGMVLLQPTVEKHTVERLPVSATFTLFLGGAFVGACATFISMVTFG